MDAYLRQEHGEGDHNCRGGNFFLVHVPVLSMHCGSSYVCYIIQIYSGITRGRVLNGELYAQRLQQLIYVYFYRLVS